MKKDFWGKAVWCLIHSTAAGYKPQNRHSYKQFIYALRGLLPCPDCRNHLAENLKTLELDRITHASGSDVDYLSNNEKLFLWTFFLHDLVNRQLHKVSPGYEAIKNYYFNSLLNKKSWGPCIWTSIHCIAAVYKPESKQAFKQFIYSLPGILPCEECRSHLIENLKILPLTDHYLENNHNLFLWTYLLHDATNKQLRKVSPSFEKVKTIYFDENFCPDCGK